MSDEVVTVEPLAAPPPLPAAYVQIESASRLIVASSSIPFVDAPPGHEMAEIMDPAEAAKLGQPGTKTLNQDGTVTVTPPPPPPIEYVNSIAVDSKVRTLDATPLEVFRFTTEVKHVYRATFQMTAIDAGSGATKDSEARMTFKRGATNAIQVGQTTVISNAQDTAAASWGIQATGQAADVVITVSGAAGRTVDWQLFGSIGVFAPDGLTG